MSYTEHKMSLASRTFFVLYGNMKEEALVQFKLMLPAGLKQQLEERAQANRRALSQEIVAVLEQALPATRDKLRRSHALVDLANIVAEFEGKEGDTLRSMVAQKLEDEMAELAGVRQSLLKSSD